MNPSSLLPSFPLRNSPSELAEEPGELVPVPRPGRAEGRSRCRQREGVRWLGLRLVRGFVVGVFIIYPSSLPLWGGRCPSIRLCWLRGQCVSASEVGCGSQGGCGSQPLAGTRELPEQEGVGLSRLRKAYVLIILRAAEASSKSNTGSSLQRGARQMRGGSGAP